MTKKKDLAFIALDPDGMNLCRKIQPHFSGSLVHGRIKRLPESDVPFSDVVTHLQTLYSSGIPVVGVCATGILVRAIAPILAKKTEEPPVIALSHDGKTVVPVLGGHHGANRLARDIAVLLGGQAAITTAADLSCGLALDNPPDGWKVGNPQTIKGLTTALLFGESVRLVVEAGNVDWLMNSSVALADTAPYSILCTDKNVQGSNKNLVLHPPTLALGVGCTRGCTQN